MITQQDIAAWREEYTFNYIRVAREAGNFNAATIAYNAARSANLMTTGIENIYRSINSENSFSSAYNTILEVPAFVWFWMTTFCRHRSP